VEAIAAHDHARQDWNAGDMRKCRCARPQSGSLQHRACAVADAALWKKANDPPMLEPLDCGSDGFAIGTISFRRKRIDGAQKKTKQRKRKEFGHGHPIDLAPYYRRNDKRIEMADVIGCQQKSTGAIWISAPQNIQPRDRPKQQFHQKRCRAIGNRVKRRIKEEERMLM